ncbi:MAG: phosphoribosyltransferase [Candidatus Zixiibacteriota bacterium]
MDDSPILINTTNDAFFLDIYRPKNHPLRAGHEHSQLIDILREKRAEEVIKRFADVLKPYLTTGICVSAVPPAVAVTHKTGIQLVAKLLASGKRIDATDCLVRMKRVPTAAETAHRTEQTHLDSITVRRPELIRDFRFLLLDDIYHTGTSLNACRKLLLDAGARQVRILVLGRTWRDEELPDRGWLKV